MDYSKRKLRAVPKVKRNKKVSRKSAVHMADVAFSAYIRTRDPVCVVCGTLEHGTCGHIFSRVHYSTRWDEDNAFRQCSGCNLRHEHDAWPFYKEAELRGIDLPTLHVKWSKAYKVSTAAILEIARYYQVKKERLDEQRGTI